MTSTLLPTSKLAADIPVIDISSSNPSAAHDIFEAAAKYGFVYVENNEAAGMPDADVLRMFDMVCSSCFDFSI